MTDNNKIFCPVHKAAHLIPTTMGEICLECLGSKDMAKRSNALHQECVEYLLGKDLDRDEACNLVHCCKGCYAYEAAGHNYCEECYLSMISAMEQDQLDDINNCHWCGGKLSMSRGEEGDDIGYYCPDRKCSNSPMWEEL